MSEFTEQRLSKLAKENGIGVQHVLDFLKGNYRTALTRGITPPQYTRSTRAC